MDILLDEIPRDVILGSRVELKILDEKDAKVFFENLEISRNFLSKHLPWPQECLTEEDVLARIESWDLQAQMGNGACWGIYEICPNGNFLAGAIIIGWIQRTHLSASVSYFLFEKFKGRGLATEALKLLSRFCFEKIGLNRLEISCSVNNESSAAVAVHCGFQKEGISRDFERINGKFEDHIRFACLKRDVI